MSINNSNNTERCAHCGKTVQRRNGNPFLPYVCPIHGDLRPLDLDSFTQTRTANRSEKQL